MKLQLILHPSKAGFGDVADGHIKWTFEIPPESEVITLELPGMYPVMHIKMPNGDYKHINAALDRVEWYAVG